MEFVKIAKSTLRSEIKKKLSQMTTQEIIEQSKIITTKVSYCLLKMNNTYFNYIVIINSVHLFTIKLYC